MADKDEIQTRKWVEAMLLIISLGISRCCGGLRPWYMERRPIDQTQGDMEGRSGENVGRAVRRYFEPQSSHFCKGADIQNVLRTMSQFTNNFSWAAARKYFLS